MHKSRNTVKNSINAAFDRGSASGVSLHICGVRHIVAIVLVLIMCLSAAGPLSLVSTVFAADGSTLLAPGSEKGGMLLAADASDSSTLLAPGSDSSSTPFGIDARNGQMLLATEDGTEKSFDDAIHQYQENMDSGNSNSNSGNSGSNSGNSGSYSADADQDNDDSDWDGGYQDFDSGDGTDSDGSSGFDDYYDLDDYSTASTNGNYADYTTPSFDVDVQVTKDHVMHVTENITCDFTGSYHHGIFRYIPVQAKFYTIKNIHVPGWYYDIDQESGTNSNGQHYKYEVVRIGDAERYLDGVNTFTVSYDMVCYEDDQTDADYLSIDLLPTGWETPIGSSTLTLTMPKDIDWDKVNLYSGSYGNSAGLSGAFKSSIDEASNTLTVTGKNISDYSGVTVSATLEDGYWENPASRRIYRLIMYAFLVIAPLIAGLMWLAFGRDPELVRTVEFYAPDGMTPAEVGYAIDGTIDNSDITALIMYYADKGWLTIRETPKGAFKLVKQQEPDENEREFSKFFFNALFRKRDTAYLDNMPESFGDDIEDTRKKIEKFFAATHRKLYTDSSVWARNFGRILMLVPGLAAVYLACQEMASGGYLFYMVITVLVQLIGMISLLGTFDKKDSRLLRHNFPRFLFGIAATGAGAAVPAVITGMVTGRWITSVFVAASILLTFFFVLFMKARSKESARRMGKILGFRDFIITAEYDRLKMLSDENPEYYYNILPYAYVLGLSTKWSKKFQNIDIPVPSWYYSQSGSNMTFNYYYYPHMMTNWNTCIQDSWTESITNRIDFSDIGGSSGGSGFGGGGSIGGGFGGGGFSGGGFGGGGGGAW